MLRTSRLKRPSGLRDHHSSATQPRSSAAITAMLVLSHWAASCQTLSIAESSGLATMTRKHATGPLASRI